LSVRRAAMTPAVTLRRRWRHARRRAIRHYTPAFCRDERCCFSAHAYGAIRDALPTPAGDATIREPRRFFAPAHALYAAFFFAIRAIACPARSMSFDADIAVCRAAAYDADIRLYAASSQRRRGSMAPRRFVPA